MSNYCTCHIDKDSCFWCDYQVVKRSLETCRKANKRYREAIKKAMNELVTPGMTKTNVYRTLNFALEGE